MEFMVPGTGTWIAVIFYVPALATAAIGFIGANAMRDEIERQDAKMETNTSCN